MDLQDHYNVLWDSTIKLFREGKFELDTKIASPDDTRFGLTIVIRPEQKVKLAMKEMLEELRLIEPFLYYYPVTNFHITVLSIISCYPGFSLNGIAVEAYRQQVQQAVQQISTFEIIFKGITASPSCVLVQGFPTDESLQQLRNLLRVQFQKSGLQQSIDSRYSIRTAHCTVARFKTNPIRPAAFLAALEKYRHHDFGTSTARQVELVYNDWYQREQYVKQLGVFALAEEKK